MYNVVMLDLDGTLTDSTGGIAQTFNTTLGEAGYPMQPDSAIVPMIGLPLATMFERFVPPDEHAVIPELIAAYRTLYAERAIPNAQLFPEVADTLRQLRDAGLLLTIASSKTSPVSRQVLAVCGIEDLFTLIMGNDCVQRLKPDPEMLLLTLEQLGYTADQSIMVGDSVHDIHMGKAAGVRTCAVTYGAGSRAELEAMEPEFVIDKFSELLQVVLGSSI